MGKHSMLCSNLTAILILLLNWTVVEIAQSEASGIVVTGNENSQAKIENEGVSNMKNLRDKLTPLQFEVTQQCGTEPPFRNEYWDNKAQGIYVDIVTGEPLFSSRDKFDSGTGWPSFTKPINREGVVEKVDKTHGMVRTEVKSKVGNSHLGHVFPDGPGAGGMRYCINSASLRFVPLAKLEEEGYGEYRSQFMPVELQSMESQPAELKSAKDVVIRREEAILAGGCFWGMEEILRGIPGVLETEVGYTGGTVANPTYDVVSSGASGHREAVKVVFDPQVLTYKDLLGFFFRMHDPTTLNRQGNDVGVQYGSVIFFTSPEQKTIAEQVRAAVDMSGKWKSPVVTEVLEAREFYPAEGYHQDYLQVHKNGYTCHFLRE